MYAYGLVVPPVPFLAYADTYSPVPMVGPSLETSAESYNLIKKLFRNIYLCSSINILPLASRMANTEYFLERIGFRRRDASGDAEFDNINSRRYSHRFHFKCIWIPAIIA